MSQGSAFRNSVVGYGIAGDVGGSRERNVRALKALAEVHARAASVPDTAAAREVAARDIQVILDEPALSSTALAALPKAMAGESDLFTMDAAAWAKGIGLGAKVGGVVLPRLLSGLLSPYGAMALQLAGVLAEPTLNYLADRAAPGRDLTLGPILPPADSSQLSALTQWVFEKSSAQTESNEALRRLVSDPTVKLQIGFDLAPDPQSLVRHLPAEVRVAISRALHQGLEGLRGDVAAQQDLMDELRARVTTGFQQISRRVESIEALLREQLGERERARAMHQALNNLEFTAGELAGTGVLGAALLTNVLGDSAAGKVFQASLAAVTQVYRAVGLYELGQIGSLAMASSFAGAGSLLLGALAPNPDDLILQAIGQVSAKLDVIAASLERVEAGQQAIRQTLAQMFREMRIDAAAARVMLTNIQGQLNEVLEDLNVNARSTDETAFGSRLDQCQTLLRRPSIERVDAAWRTRYGEFLTAFYSYAARVSKQPAFTGDGVTQLDVATVRDLIRTRRRAELLFGALPRIVELVGASVPLGESMPTGDTLPNPLTWAQGVNAYLEARALAPEVTVEDDRAWLPLLWKDGLRIRAATQAAGSYRSVRAATNSFLATVGVEVASSALATSPTLLGCVQRSVTAFEATEFASHYTLAQRERNAPRGGETVYSTGPFNRTFPIRADPDPINLAVQLGLIENQATFDGEWGPHKRFACRLVMRVGPQSGQFVLGKTLYEHRITDAGNGMSGVYRCWNPPAPDGDGSNPAEVLDECVGIIRRFVDFPKLRASFPDVLRRDLIAASLVTFEGYGHVLQLLATLARWRQMRATIEPLSTEIASMPLFVMVDHIVGFVGTFLKKEELSTNASWVAPVVDGLRAEFNNQTSYLLDVADAAGTNESPLVVDETMRRLGGYMRASGIDVPLPAVPVDGATGNDLAPGNRMLSALLEGEKVDEHSLRTGRTGVRHGSR